MAKKGGQSENRVQYLKFIDNRRSAKGSEALSVCAKLRDSPQKATMQKPRDTTTKGESRESKAKIIGT